MSVLLSRRERLSRVIAAWRPPSRVRYIFASAMYASPLFIAMAFLSQVMADRTLPWFLRSIARLSAPLLSPFHSGNRPAAEAAVKDERSELRQQWNILDGGGSEGHSDFFFSCGALLPDALPPSSLSPRRRGR